MKILSLSHPPVRPAAILTSVVLFVNPFAQGQPQFSLVQRNPNREIALTLSVQAGNYYQLDATSNFLAWDALTTLAAGAASSLQHTDSAAPFLDTRYYRAQQLSGTNLFVGDHLRTTNGDVILLAQRSAAGTSILYRYPP